MATTKELIVGEEGAGCRLDVYLAEKDVGPSRSFIRKLIDDAKVAVNGRNVKAGYKLSVGDRITVEIPPPVTTSVDPQAIPLSIVYEDEHIAVINKPQGMVVHPAAGNRSGTLVNALLHHCRDLSGIGGTIRPGIVHRLDKDTAGLLVIAKNDSAHLNLARQIKDRTAVRLYLAIVHGRLSGSGTIDAPIGRHPVHRKKMAVTSVHSRPAVTHYSVLENLGDFTLVKCKLETGRTHQIRVHMAYIGHPVAGDPVYGPQRNRLRLSGQALFAFSLEVTHPNSGERMRFTAPLPEELRDLLEELRARKRKSI